MLWQERSRASRLIIAERIAGPGRVAPEPIQLASIHGADRAVLPHNAGVQRRLGQRCWLADEQAIAIDIRPCDAIQPLGNIEPIDSQLGDCSRDSLQGLPAIPKTVLGKLIPRAGDVKENFLAHQPRIENSNDAVAVGIVPHVVDRAQLDKRDSATGLPIDDRDLEVLVGSRRLGCERPKGNQCDRG